MMLLLTGEPCPVGPLGILVGWVMLVELDIGKGKVLPEPTGICETKLLLADTTVEGDVVAPDRIP